MLTLVKLIQTLNSPLVSVKSTTGDRSNSTTPDRAERIAMRFRSVCALVALSLAGLGSIETAQAQSVKTRPLANNDRQQSLAGTESGIDRRIKLDPPTIDQ